MGAIKSESPTPKYQQLAGLIRDRINTGEFAPGDRIPSEAELGSAYDLSRITIRQALADLEREGLLDRISGKGTFVRQRTSHVERPSRLTGFGENLAALGLEPSYRTLRAEAMRVDRAIADRLDAHSGKVYVVRRVLYADGDPVALHTSYLPLWLVKAAAPDAFSMAALDSGSMYEAMTEAGARFFRAEEIVDPGIADAEEAELLEMEEGGLLLRVSRTVFDPDNIPIEYVLMVYRADSYTYRTTIYAGSGD